MESKKLGFIKRIWLSISSFNFINIPLKEKKRKAFGYILVITLLLIILPVAALYSMLNNYQEMISKVSKEDLPSFVVNNGKLDLQGNSPYYSDSNGTIIILDDQQSYDYIAIINDNKSKDIVIMSRDNIYIKESGNKGPTRMSYSLNFNGFDNKRLKILADMSQNLLNVLFFTMFFMLLLFKACGILISWLIAIIVCSFKRCTLSSSDMFKITCYALTLPKLVSIIPAISPFNIPLGFLIYNGIFVYYIIKYLENINNNNQVETVDNSENVFYVE